MGQPSKTEIFKAICAKIHEEFDKIDLPDDIFRAAKDAAISAAIPRDT